MPFGLTNAPASFQRLMNSILASHNWICSVVYLDDIIIYSDNFEKHMTDITKIINELRSYNLTINFTKSEFCRDEIEYLGYILSDKGITINPEKTQAITNYPAPKNMKETQQFLGLVSYFRRFVNKFSLHAEPLTKLTRKDIKFEWKTEQEESFKYLKNNLINSPILKLPDYDKKFHVSIDASKLALGAVLTQYHNEVEHVVCYASRSTKLAEKNYSTYELEGLALLFALKVWRCYLLHNKFILYTDNKALTFLQRNKDLNARLTRWSLKLAEYDFEIVHRTGKSNKVADALSRIDYENNEILKINETETRKINTLLYNDEQHEKKSLEQKQKIIFEHHYDLVHANARTVYKSLKNFYRWKDMRNDCIELLKTCPECLIFNEDKITKANYPILIGESMERVGIDVIGPLIESEEGNKYIVIAIDYLTKFIFLHALKEKSATEIALFVFEDIILEHGCPNILLSDNGREFKNEIIESLCKLMSIDKKYSSPYRPQTNGLVERTNRTLLGILSKTVHKYPKRWDTYLRIIKFNYNIRYQESIKSSPFQLLYGRHPNLPNIMLQNKQEELSIERIKRIAKFQEEIMQKRNYEKKKNNKRI